MGSHLTPWEGWQNRWETQAPETLGSGHHSVPVWLWIHFGNFYKTGTMILLLWGLSGDYIMPIWIAWDLAYCLWSRYFENSCCILVLFSLSVWEELLYPHAVVSQAVCFLLWMLASVTELLWWGLAALKLESLPDSWHMPWHYWCLSPWSLC